MDGILDWYLLGVVAGLGVAAGVGCVGIRRTALWALAPVLAGGAAIALVLLTLPLWTLLLPVAAAVAAFFSLRRLSPQALPAAALAAVVLAAVPALGYVAAAGVPVAGARLSRRASERYAGLRILAKD